MSQHTNTAFCGQMLPNDILTSERPPQREVNKLCQMCRRLYNKNLNDEQAKRQETLNNRSNRVKFHDWLYGISSIGDSEMEIIYYPMLILMTCGLVIPTKHLAKLLLRVGV
jgi:hypothetical protein